MHLPLLTNFEMKKYQHEPRFFNEVYWRDNVPDKITNGAYVINFDEYSDIRTHWIVLYLLNSNITYFDSFGIEHIPKEIIKLINNRSTIVTNIFRIQADDSVMCGYFCIKFIDFMLKVKLDWLY